MSEVKVNKITPTADCGTVTLGDSGDTIAIPSGTTVTAPSANVTNSGTVNSTTITNSGTLTNSGTITNTGTISGGTISGTIDGSVNWQTTVKTTAFTATAGEGYFCNTTSAAFTVTLPASPSAGDIVGIKDYANTADTNNITIGRNGSNIQGVANDYVISTEGLSIVLLYVDATKGWLSVGQAKANDITELQAFVTATGGTITTSGNFKIHTFTGPGTFTVTCAGTAPGSNTVDYLVVGGGGAGSPDLGGGGGAGGYRESSGAASGCYSRSPLGACVSALPVSVQGYPITVGAGGSQPGGNGANSIFSSITSTGGGGGEDIAGQGNSGGSGGGSGSGRAGCVAGGVGNTPPVSPPQGNPGGPAVNTSPSNPSDAGSGGGGAGAAGNTSNNNSGGGNGVTSSINTTPTTRAGGGGGGAFVTQPNNTGGSGGGGRGGQGPGADPIGQRTGVAGTANTGGGAGSGGQAGGAGGNGGSGIVIIRYKFQ